MTCLLSVGGGLFKSPFAAVTLMATQGGITLDALRVDGGAAVNNLLCQLQANVLDRPVDRSAELQTTGLGAAFLAGLGVGIWSSTDALASVRASSGVFTPRADASLDPTRWRRAVARSRDWALDS